MKTLLLWLEGNLQSWGADSRYGNRATLPFPTRSGVLGLLCCAAGYDGEQIAWLAEMAEPKCTQTVRAYARKTRSGEAQRQPLLRDFHMVGAGYDMGDKWQNLLVPKTAKGKRPGGTPQPTGQKITIRYYLQDMAYACALQLPDDEAAKLEKALENPVWELSLGRRNCPPSDIIGRGLFDDDASAFAKAEEIAAAKNRALVLEVRDGAHENGDEIWTLNDVPLCFGQHKRYRDRQVTLFSPQESSATQDTQQEGQNAQEK